MADGSMMKRLLYAVFRTGICSRCDGKMLPWRDGNWACPNRACGDLI
jgi:hypothetical protein